jgi:hypothetical protein
VIAPALLKAHDVRRPLEAQLRLCPLSYPKAWAEWQANAGVSLQSNTLERSFEHNTYMTEGGAGLGVAICHWAFVMDDVVRASGRAVWVCPDRRRLRRPKA